ncbi:hypothetical protein [Desmospora profundinema]|uniref:Lipoprotein n=1 Tax=Desmospora profundinema TaxID=1571184 RepID=A0ABU1IQB4_9BACL|nr:hypothetical protein [Desmospora profundinema]MDR6226329.1 hypothetical protein [Desmospora profundinema]
MAKGERAGVYRRGGWRRWSRFWLAVWVAMTLTACVPGEFDESQLPPLPRITVDGKEVKSVQSSYCWKTWNSSVCADMAHSVDLMKKESAVSVRPGALIELEYEDPPDTRHIEAFRESEPLEREDDEAWTVPAEPGRVVFRVTGWWKEGDSSVAFVVEVER